MSQQFVFNSFTHEHLHIQDWWLRVKAKRFLTLYETPPYHASSNKISLLSPQIYPLVSWNTSDPGKWKEVSSVCVTGVNSGLDNTLNEWQ